MTYAIAAPLQSSNQHSDTWHPTCTYDHRGASTPLTHLFPHPTSALLATLYPDLWGSPGTAWPCPQKLQQVPASILSQVSTPTFHFCIQHLAAFAVSFLDPLPFRPKLRWSLGRFAKTGRSFSHSENGEGGGKVLGLKRTQQRQQSAGRKRLKVGAKNRERT